MPAASSSDPHQIVRQLPVYTQASPSLFCAEDLMREGKLEDLKDSDPECYRFLRQFAGLQLDQPDAEPPETGAGLLDL